MTQINTQGDSDRASSEHPGAEQDLVLEFSRGVDLSRPPHKLEEGFCRGITNMYYPRESGILRTRPGLTALTAAGAGDAATAVHVYRPAIGTSYTCFTVINSTKQELWYQTGTDAAVLIKDDLGSLLTPCMVTFNGVLLIAIPGQNILEWQGFTSASPAAARGGATATFTDTPANNETITIGAEIWTWKTAGTAVPPYQVNLGTGGTAGDRATASAANLKNAINTDSSVVYATVEVGSNTVCRVWARRIGTAGNLAMVDAMTNATISGNLAGGVNGLALDSISSYLAPKPGALIVDWNQRLVASADSTAPDTVFFSTPDDQWQWATGVYGGGETFLLGNLDGTDTVALHSFLGQLVVHKAGQGREIYRIDTSNADPATWTSTVKKFRANTAALNQRCVAAVTDKQLFLDTRGFSVMSGTDALDEITIGGAGGQLADKLAGASAATAFFVVNPDENYIMVFPIRDHNCWVFHYGSGRWVRWEFKTADVITCGAYHDGLGAVLLGTLGGEIFRLDPLQADDDGTEFSSEVVTRALMDGALKQVLVKQTLLDWKNVIAGAGSAALLINNEDTPSQQLFAFDIEDTDLLLADTTTLMLEDAIMPLLSSSYGRANSFTQGGGELVSLQVRLRRGAFQLNGVTLRVAYHGRIAK